MPLLELSLSSFRCFPQLLGLRFHTINLFIGENGSGKTSLLEAIHLLCRGKSFRTSCLDDLIRQGSGSAEILGGFENAEEEPLHLKVTHQQGLKLHQATRPLPISSLAHCYPLDLMTTESLTLLTEGPEARRRMVDWGCYQLDPSHLSLWSRYRRLLQHRNSLLRTHATATRLLEAQDFALSEAAEALNQRRLAYLQGLFPSWETLLGDHFPALSFRCSFHPGWEESKGYLSCLQKNRAQDQALGYTRWGAHRADLQLTASGKRPQERFSRGELKLIFLLLKIEQLRDFQRRSSKPPILLLDDLFSEMDHHRIQAGLEHLNQLPAQLFFTLLEAPRWPHKLFSEGVALHLSRPPTN